MEVVKRVGMLSKVVAGTDSVQTGRTTELISFVTVSIVAPLKVGG
jgi:hypothetical protein